MDFLSKRSIEISALAMDGLAARHKALAANISNVNTPDYKRVDVSFEGKLQNILQRERFKDDIKADNTRTALSRHYSDVKAHAVSLSLDGRSGQIGINDKDNNDIHSRMSFNSRLIENNYKDFVPEIAPDNDYVMERGNGNNVNIESEVIESMKVGTRYTALADLQSKAFRGIQDAIKGGM